MPVNEPVRPRQKLPPPTTTATSTSRFCRSSMMSSAVAANVAPSRPLPDSPASASPDGLKTIRFQLGRSAGRRPERGMVVWSVMLSPWGRCERGGPAGAPGCQRCDRSRTTAGSADLDLRELDDRGPAEHLTHGLLVVLGVGLIEQGDVLEEP